MYRTSLFWKNESYLWFRSCRYYSTEIDGKTLDLGHVLYVDNFYTGSVKMI